MGCCANLPPFKIAYLHSNSGAAGRACLNHHKTPIIKVTACRLVLEKKLKTIVVNERENERVPFLRGILTHSLLDAGLVFADAFQLASKVRDQLADIPEITSEELRHRRQTILLQDPGHQPE